VKAGIAPGLKHWTRGVRAALGRVSARHRPALLRRLLGAERRRRAPPEDVPEIRWFADRDGYGAYVEPTRAARRAAEAEICRAGPLTPGFCTFCAAPTTFVVSGGTMLGPDVNLREGLVCARCGLGNRLRLLFKALEDTSGGEAGLRARKVYLAERVTPFFARLSERVGALTGSEYVGDACAPGSVHAVRGLPVRHEDLGRLSFPDEAFDLVAHADVLEHLPDHRAALAEMCRVTRRGGAMLFSVPFLHGQVEHEVRATVGDDGRLVHHMPAVYHGNPLSSSGSLTFRTYGWSLLDELRGAGFDAAEVGVLTDLSLGFASSNSSYADYMEPMVVRARRLAR